MVELGAVVRVVDAVTMGWCREECIHFANIRTSLERIRPIRKLLISCGIAHNPEWNIGTGE